MELLEIKDISKKLAFKTENVNLWHNINSLLRRINELDFNVYLPTKGINLQRELCWNNFQKEQLILSIINNRYIPKICVLVGQDENYDNPIYEIIDGKQRLNAMLSFLNNEFPLHYDNNEYYFKDCSIELQFIIKTYSPSCEVGYYDERNKITDQDKIDWFKMINFGGTAQDIEHLNKL